MSERRLNDSETNIFTLILRGKSMRSKSMLTEKVRGLSVRVLCLVVVGVMCLGLYPVSSTAEMPITNLASGVSYAYITEPGFGLAYTWDNETTKLTDGIISIGDRTDGNYSIWDDVDAVIVFDLGETMTVDEVAVHCLSRTGYSIYFPVRVAISVSLTGSTFTETYNETTSEVDGNPLRAWIFASFDEVSARYVKVFLFHYTTGGDKDSAVSEVVIKHRPLTLPDSTAVVSHHDFDMNMRMLHYFNITNATYGLIFYDGHLWSSSYNHDRIEKLDPTTGETVLAITVRDKPKGLVWDPFNEWLWYFADTDKLFVAIDLDGAEQTTFARNIGLNLNEDGLGQEEDNLILVDDDTDTVWFISKTDGTNVSDTTINPETEGIDTDSAGNHWIQTELPDRITLYSSDFTTWGYSIPSVYGRSTGIALDETNATMFISAEFSSQISAVSISNLSYGFFDYVRGSWGIGDNNGTENNQLGFGAGGYSGIKTTLAKNFDDPAWTTADGYDQLGIVTFDTWLEAWDLSFSGHIPSCAGNERIGIVWGYQNASNFNILWLDDTADRVYYNAMVNDTLTWPTWNQYTSSFSITATAWHDYRIIFDGELLTIYDPNAETIHATKDWSTFSPWTSGKVGFGCWAGPFEVDDVLIRPYGTNYEGQGDFYLTNVLDNTCSLTTFSGSTVNASITTADMVLLYDHDAFSTYISSSGTWINFSASKTQYDFKVGMSIEALAGIAITPTIWSPTSSHLVAGWGANEEARYTIYNLDSTTGYRVYQDGEEIFRQHSGYSSLSFTATGGGEFVVEVWDPYAIWEDSANLLFMVGIPIGLAAAIMVAVFSRVRRG